MDRANKIKQLVLTIDTWDLERLQGYAKYYFEEDLNRLDDVAFINYYNFVFPTIDNESTH